MVDADWLREVVSPQVDGMLYWYMGITDLAAMRY